MESIEDLVEIGRLAKPHGLKGEVEVVLTTNLVVARTQAGSVFYASEHPTTELTLVSARPKKDRWLFAFTGFDSRESLEPLKGSMLLAKPLDGFMAHDLIDKEFVDQHGTKHGLIKAIVANPADDLVELESGLLASIACFIKLDGETAYFDIPDGLFEAQSG